MNHNHIDIYCERLGPGFWAEPLNATSNIAFIVSATLLAWGLHREHDNTVRDPALWVLVALVFMIGAGSGLFHTLAVRWAMLADIVPITLFILTYIYLGLRRFFRFGVWASLLCVVLVLAATGAIPALTGFGGSSYVPALAVTLLVGLVFRFQRRRETGNALLIAGCVFAASLGIRTADDPLCSVFPIGTHFLWHVLNAVVLYIVTRAMIRFAYARSHL